MNSVLLCEGSTDFALLQYFMRKVYGWEDKERGPGFLRPSRVLGKDGNKLVIGGTGGSSQILSKLEKRDKNHQNRWNKVWADPLCQRYRRADHEDYWLWNPDFFSAPVLDLRHIAALVGA